MAADVVLAPSLDLIERMKDLGFGEAIKTDLPLLQAPHPTESVEQGPVRFLFASTIIPTKGTHRLVDAFLAMSEEATLSIAGHAPAFAGQPDYASRLQAQVREHPRAHWIGPVEPDQIPSLIAEHDVLVLPSLWPENSPLVVREATAAGIQVIASHIGGTGELAPDALLVRDDHELLDAMNRLAREGRMRQAPAVWPTPAEHAKSLMRGPYMKVHA